MKRVRNIVCLFALAFCLPWTQGRAQETDEPVVLRMEMKSLILEGKDVTAIDVRGTALEELQLSDNGLDTIDVSGCVSLEVLEIDGNLLAHLDISETKVPELVVANGVLGSLKASRCPALRYIDCRNNDLTELDIDGSTSIDTLYCGNNRLSLQTLYTVLQNRSQNGTFFLGTQHGDEQNLRVEETMDLSTLLTVAGTESEIVVNSLFRQPVSAYRYTFSGGRLAFHVNGDYRVVQTHPEVRDYVNGVAGEPAERIWVVKVDPPLAQIGWFDCGGEGAADGAGNGVFELDVSGCGELSYLDCRNNDLNTLGLGGKSPIMELHAENNGMSLSTVYALSAARHKEAAYHFSPQTLGLKYLREGESWDLRSEFTIDDCPSDYTLYDASTGEVAAAQSYTLNNGMLTMRSPGSYRLELSNRAVTDYTENGTLGSPVSCNYPIQVGASGELHTVSVRSEDIVRGTVSGGGTYAEGEYATITATANAGYEFSHWENNGSYFSDQTSLTFQVDGDFDIVAYFIDPDEEYTVIVRSEDLSKGTVSGGGTYASGDYARAYATANAGYVFDRWENYGVYFSNERNLGFYVNGQNYDLTAYFKKEVGNEDGTTAGTLRVYAKDKVIYLSEEVEEVRVFTIAGQLVYAGRSTAVPVTAPGVYVVRVGAACHKVMVF